MVPRLAVLGLAFVLSGCTTATTAEYINLKTGQKYVCYRQAAFGAIPAAVSGSSYADCKTFFESQGFVRRDPKTDAILRHFDPTLTEALSTPPASPPAPSNAPTHGFCFNRARTLALRTEQDAEYRRCMAGY